jgi:hypothetical protein
MIYIDVGKWPSSMFFFAKNCLSDPNMGLREAKPFINRKDEADAYIPPPKAKCTT